MPDCCHQLHACGLSLTSVECSRWTYKQANRYEQPSDPSYTNTLSRNSSAQIPRRIVAIMPAREKHLTRRQRQDQQAARAASSEKVSKKPSSATNEEGSGNTHDSNVQSGSTSSKDVHHMAAIQVALDVVSNVGPLLHMQRALPAGSSFTMEKSVFDVPMADVKRALAYYEELEVRGGLTEQLCRRRRRAKSVPKSARREQTWRCETALPYRTVMAMRPSVAL